ncbi:MAG: hypothetical protein Q4C95_05830 [Planctomycetia bacterium]|nr:hypothetical protein [Planctomycetia bacterium]
MKQRVSLTFAATALVCLAFFSFFYYLALPSPFSSETAVVPRYLCNGFLVLDWFQTEFLEKHFALAERIPIILWTFFCLVSVWGYGSLIWFILCKFSKGEKKSATKSSGFLKEDEKKGSYKRLYNLSWGEENFFSLGLGLVFWSTLLFLMGVVGMANQILIFRMITLIGFLGGIWKFVSLFRMLSLLRTHFRSFSNAEQISFVLFFLILIIALILALLGGMLPPIDYDVLEYHAQGPREFFEKGKIGFSAHNVYLNMPLGVEMFLLWGINLTGRIFEGILVGKTFLSCLMFLSVWGIFLWTRRIANDLFEKSLKPFWENNVNLLTSTNSQNCPQKKKTNEKKFRKRFDQNEKESFFSEFAKINSKGKTISGENSISCFESSNGKRIIESEFLQKTQQERGTHLIRGDSGFANLAAILSSLFYLTLPDNFQVFTNGLNDGVLGLALLLSGFSFFLYYGNARFFQRNKNSFRNRLFPEPFFLILTGIFCGFAVSIKYTAVVFVWIPVFLGLIYSCRSRFKTEDFGVNNLSDMNKFEKSKNGLLCLEAKRKTGELFFVLLIFASVSFLVGGGWLMKNAVWVHNPIYPLGYSIFGSMDELLWNDAKDLRWTTAHSSECFSLRAFGETFHRFFYLDYFVSPFCAITLFLLAFVALVYWKMRRFLKGLAVSDSSRNLSTSLNIKKVMKNIPENKVDQVLETGHCLTFDSVAISNAETSAFDPLNPLVHSSTLSKAWAFGWKSYWGLTLYFLAFLLIWFFMTHRLTRFLVPVFPILAILFGIGCCVLFVISRKRLISISFACLLVLGFHWTSIWEFLLISDCLTPYSTILNDPLRSHSWMIWFNQHPELFGQTKRQNIQNNNQFIINELNDLTTSRLLLVYEANAFAYRVPILYNTCWDETVFPVDFECRKLIRSGKDLSPIDIGSIFDNLKQKNIDYILVHFGERNRFLSEGNYGVCNPEIDQLFFDRLIQLGILEPFRPSEYWKFDEYSRKNIEVYRVKYPI